MAELLFVYGILKRGHAADLAGKAGTRFITTGRIPNAKLHKIGWGVGLRFDNTGKHVAHGEVWEIPAYLWNWLDGIESNGFCYTRKVIEVENTGVGAVERPMLKAWVYEHTFPGMKYGDIYPGGVYPLREVNDANS